MAATIDDADNSLAHASMDLDGAQSDTHQDGMSTDSHSHGFYSKRRRILARNWQSEDPHDWLPKDMLDSTHYSLTLLDALARLSSISKGRKREAHEAILQARSRRLENWPRECVDVITPVDNNPIEQEVVERANGIMLCDIRQAQEQIKEERKSRKQHLNEREDGLQKAAADRVMQRRKQKHARDVELQQELWKGVFDDGVRLVGMEYSNRLNALDSTASIDVPLSWQELRRHAKQHRKGKENHSHKLAALPQDQLFREYAAARSARYASTGAVRAQDISHLSSQLEEDDISWGDSSVDEDSDRDLSLELSMDQEPTIQQHSTRARKAGQKPVNQLTNAVQARSALLLDPDHGSESRTRRKRKHEHRQRATQQHVRWRKEIEARSQRLPTEIMDFSTMGKLQSVSDNTELTNMTEALCGMLDSSEQHSELAEDN